MKFETAAMLVLLGAASARPDAIRQASATSGRVRREVPQEHSHEKFVVIVRELLNLNNPDKIQDPIFGLLGNAAAAAGAGAVTNLDCLHQRTADQAFTNAKAAGDVEGQAAALIFRAIERNTGGVGVKSVLCTETAVNPEIGALQQHQDPASDGAAALNKQIALTLAVQLASVGADPQLAIQSGTFAPGDKNDNTGKGNSCDDLDDPEGCIFTKNLLVPDVTAAEITAAVGSGNTGNVGNGNAGNAGNSTGNAGNNNTGNNNNQECIAEPSATATATAAASATASATPTTGNASGTNVNAFTGSVGAPPVPVISSAASRPFSVNGSTFLNIGAAVQRACDVQKNQCANAANSGAGGSVSDCDAQQQQCIVANQGQKRRRGQGRVWTA